jgi:hypothetical protein
MDFETIKKEVKREKDFPDSFGSKLVAVILQNK